MHFFSRRNASLAFGLAAVGVLAACGDDVTVPVAPAPPVTISITPQAVTLNPGAAATLSVQIAGGSPTPTLASCTSANTAVATATASGNACNVSGVAAGSTTITATTSGGQAASASVTVSSLQAALGDLTVSPATTSLTPGQSVTLVPNANPAPGVTPTFSYTSSAPAIASVSSTGQVTAVAPGTATVTVTANGTGTGFAPAQRQFGVTIVVTNAPAGVTSLTVTPASLSLAIGGQGQLATVVAQPSGATAASVTFGTTNPAIATVTAGPNGTATVTGVAAGTATITVTATAAASTNFAAATLTQLIPVTVAAPANVTIQTITQGPQRTTYSNVAFAEGLVTSDNPQVNQPIDVNNTRDQIQVVLNLQPFGQRVDSVVVFIADEDGSNRRPAARQLYSNGVANEGTITLFVNTADFDVDFDAGTADVFFENGRKNVSASVFTTRPDGMAQEIQNAENNRQTLNFNNLDGYAAEFNRPARSAVRLAGGGANLNWHGGPGAEGASDFTVVPVFYTPDRELRTITVQMREGLVGMASNGVCSNTRTYQGPAGTTPSPLPYNPIYSKADTTGIVCNGYQHANVETNAQNFPGVIAAIDGQNNPAPLVRRPDGYRTSPQVAAIVPIRLDYAGPAAVTPDILRARPAITGWVNASFNFNSNTAASNDGGVGMPATQSRTWAYFGCGIASTAAVPMATATGTDIPECGSDFTGGWDNAGPATRGPYRVRYVEADALGNETTATQSGLFGVDKTAPLIRFSTATVADTAVFEDVADIDGNGTAFALQAEFIDERAGFVDVSDNGAPVKNPGTVFPATINTASFITVVLTGTQYAADRAQTHNLVHAAGLLPQANFATRSQCLLPNPAVNPLWRQTTTVATTAATIQFPAATFLSNPGCTQRNARTLQGAPLGDGYRPGEVIGVPAEGIFRYDTRVVDRAGNLSTIVTRTYGFDNTAPTKGSVNAPLSIAQGGAAEFTMVAEDNVEVRATTLALTYAKFGNAVADENASVGAADTLLYPQTLLDARFNDVINSPIQTQLSTPMGAPFVGSVEFTTAVNAVNANAAAALGKANSVNAVVWDFFGRANTGNLAASPILGTSIPNGTTWNAFLALAANSNITFNTFSVLPSRNAGFNAGIGLKAQVVAPTNAINAPFARVDFYRRGTDAAEVNQLQYLGSVAGSAAIPADGGTVRYWTYLLADGAYAFLPTNFLTRQANVTAGDEIIAIGVRTTGEGLITQATTINAPAIALTIAGLPTGVRVPAQFVNIVGPGGNITVGVSGTYTFTAGGNYSVTATDPITVDGVAYAPAVAVQNVAVPGAGAPVAVTVTYNIVP